MRERRGSARRLFEGQAEPRMEQAPASQFHINDLPEPLLLEIFRQLGRLPPVSSPEEEALYAKGKLPFRTFEYPGEVHPGLRSYPFLAQVCRHWKQALEGPAVLQLWGELVVDFGHELITGVHVPVAWSDVRPSDEEFREAFAAVRLRSHRLVEFVRARRGALRRLVLANSEGYWAEDGEFVPLASKHDFNLGTLGIILGMVAEGLAELQISHCNDLFASGSPLSTIAMLRGLRSLVLDDLQCRIYREQLVELGRLTALTELTISATQRPGMPFIFGLDAIPDSWCHLGALRMLELRGNALLDSLPAWMPSAMPRLEMLDVSACARLDLRSLPAFTQLKTLALQALDLVSGSTPQRLLAQAAQHGVAARAKQLPDLATLSGLAALNLADNNLHQLPPWLLKLRQLEVIDLSGNFFLEVAQPLAPGAFVNLRYLDLRAIHVEQDSKFWSPAKCTTMQHITALAKSLRRRNRHCRVLHDTS